MISKFGNILQTSNFSLLDLKSFFIHLISLKISLKVTLVKVSLVEYFRER